MTSYIWSIICGPSPFAPNSRTRAVASSPLTRNGTMWHSCQKRQPIDPPGVGTEFVCLLLRKEHTCGIHLICLGNICCEGLRVIVTVMFNCLRFYPSLFCSLHQVIRITEGRNPSLSTSSLKGSIFSPPYSAGNLSHSEGTCIEVPPRLFDLRRRRICGDARSGLGRL